MPAVRASTSHSVVAARGEIEPFLHAAVATNILVALVLMATVRFVQPYVIEDGATTGRR